MAYSLSREKELDTVDSLGITFASVFSLFIKNEKADLYPTFLKVKNQMEQLYEKGVHRAILEMVVSAGSNKSELFNLLPLETDELGLTDWTPLFSSEDDIEQSLVFLRAEGFDLETILSHIRTIHPDLEQEWKQKISEAWTRLNLSGRLPSLILRGLGSDIDKVYFSIVDHSENEDRDFINIDSIEPKSSDQSVPSTNEEIITKLKEIKANFEGSTYREMKITFDGASLENARLLIEEFKSKMIPSVLYTVLE